MTTINQLVRKNRKDKTKKSKSPVLNVGFNSKERKATVQNSPQKRGVCTSVNPRSLKYVRTKYIRSLRNFNIFWL